MEPTVEFPDRELAESPKHGVVFRIPIAETDETETQAPDWPRRYLRPHSAKSSSHDTPSRMVPTKTKAIRPWTAHAKTRSESSQSRRLARQTLKKPHFRAPPRSPTASICSDTSSLITAVGLETKKSLETSTQDAAHHPEPTSSLPPSRVEDASHKHDERWATRVANTLHEEVEPVKPEPPKRTLKKYPSFDTWIAGSPHDSDEYDTDLEIDDFVKTTSEEKTVDPTGTAMYKEECERQGIIPVSYMQRHLGDKNLRMRHHYLGGSGTKPVALALRFNTITENLDLGDNFVEAEGATYIAAMLKENTFITSLNLSRNFIGKEGMRALSRMLETNTTLKSLNISGNQLTDGCAQCLIEGLKNNSSVTSLDLSNNDFGEKGGIYIGDAIGVNEGVIDLDISWNAIRNKGAVGVIASLSKNKSLEVLDLSWNGVGLAGAEALKQALKVNTTLKVLDLTNNRINTRAAESLAWGLARNFGLETLVLNLNPMKDAGVGAILKAAENHPNLQLLSLEEVNITKANYEKIRDLQSEKGITILYGGVGGYQRPTNIYCSTKANNEKIRDLQSEKGITILYGGVGGYQRPTTAASLMKIFLKFVQTRPTELEIAFKQYDMERSGLLGIEDLKSAMKEAGLRLTNRQMTIVLDEINYLGHTTMNYRSILNGQALAQYLIQRPSRTTAAKSLGLNLNTLTGSMRRQLTVS